MQKFVARIFCFHFTIFSDITHYFQLLMNKPFKITKIYSHFERNRDDNNQISVLTIKLNDY